MINSGSVLKMTVVYFLRYQNDNQMLYNGPRREQILFVYYNVLVTKLMMRWHTLAPESLKL